MTDEVWSFKLFFENILNIFIIPNNNINLEYHFLNTNLYFL